MRRRRYADGRVRVDRLVDEAEATVSIAARQLCCRLNADANSFARAADNLLAATGIRVSPELLRQTVEREGKRALACCAKGEPPCPWTAGRDCKVPGDGAGTGRLYLGCDGFHVGLVTDAREAQTPRGRPGKTAFAA